MASSLLVIGELLSGEEEVGWGMVRGGEMIEATGRDLESPSYLRNQPTELYNWGKGGRITIQ